MSRPLAKSLAHHAIHWTPYLRTDRTLLVEEDSNMLEVVGSTGIHSQLNLSKTKHASEIWSLHKETNVGAINDAVQIAVKVFQPRGEVLESKLLFLADEKSTPPLEKSSAQFARLPGPRIQV